MSGAEMEVLQNESSGKEFRVTIKFRNNRLVAARESSGMTVAAICQAAGVHITQYYDLESLRVSPINADGLWTRTATKLAIWAKVAPTELFPSAIQKWKAKSSKTIELSAADVQQLMPPTMVDLPSPEECLQSKRLSANVASALDDVLFPRERQVIDMRFGLNGNYEHHLEEIAEKMELSTERIRQIEAGALRKLRKKAKNRPDVFGLDDRKTPTERFLEGRR